MPLEEHGLRWIQPSAPLTHPFDDGTAAVLERSLDHTCERFGADGPRYRRAILTLVANWPSLAADLLAPVHFPSHPYLFARFGLLAPWPGTTTARTLFRSPSARALFAGVAAHSILPLEKPFVSAIAWPLILAAHAGGWPIPRGGAQAITDALVSYLKSLGGEVESSHGVRSLDELREADLILADITPRQLLALAGDRLPRAYRRKLERYRYGPGVFKMDWALRAPIPWRSAECARSATVHLGGTLEEIAASERAAWSGETAPPFVLLVQPSLFDSTRAPEGQHTAWAYCHVPNGSTEDCSQQIERQVERFAPGFKATILARSTMGPGEMERHNANLIGGDITGGSNTATQLFLRPTSSMYRTPVKRLYLCSASTPPGGGVHGLCGYHAARWALKDLNA
jgi:phytoene dehydrogenase-like protein